MNIASAIKTFIGMRYISSRFSEYKLHKYQQKMLNKQLVFMKKNSPFYRNIDADDINSLPIVDKKIMMEKFNEMNTVGADRDKALEIAVKSEHTRDFAPKYGGLSVGLSSGTSGHRGLFLISDEERCEWAGGILAKMLPKGDIFGHKVAFFLRADNNLYETINSRFIEFRYFDLLDDMHQNLKELEKYFPTILAAPAAVLKNIGKALCNGEINISPKKVISVAEVLTEADERFIKKAFGKEVIHQVYQCTEGLLGCTCEYGSIHLNEDIVFFEKEFLDEKRFVPIITDFRRKSQPIMRYRLNDILVYSDKKCKCGQPFAVIERIEGREDDVFIFEGEKGDVAVYADFIGRCLVYVDDITEYKVVQTDKKSVTIHIDNVAADAKNAIEAEFKRLADIKGFYMPKIDFEKYIPDPKRKTKRIERMFAYEKY